MTDEGMNAFYICIT